MTVERMSVEKLKEWRADPGWTAITIEVWPHQAITVSMPDRDLDQELRRFETTMKISEADRSDVAWYAGVRRAMRDQLTPAIARYDRGAVLTCAVAAIWCALNHPNDQGLMRLKMERLKEEGHAPHFTLARGPHGTYGTGLGDRYADLRREVQHRIGPETTILAGRDY